MTIKERINSHINFAIGFAIYVMARLLIASYRKTIITTPAARELLDSGKPTIFAFWHGRILPMSFMRERNREYRAIISRHGDGEVFATIMKLNGVEAVRGSAERKGKGVHHGLPSKNRGGGTAIRESIRALQNGESLVITPDGPRGPKFIYKTNSIRIAAGSAAPILPASFSASCVKVLGTWDRFVVPLPFSKLTLEYGDPVYVPETDSDEEFDKYGKQVENCLNEMTARLDAQFNVKLEKEVASKP